jgi:hypothetical protein
MGKKRVSSSSGSDALGSAKKGRKPAGGRGAAEPASASDDSGLKFLASSAAVQAHLHANLWITDVLSRFDKEMVDHGGPVAYLDSVIGDPAKLLHYCNTLDTKFPENLGVEYMDQASFSVYGRKMVRPWMLAYHKQSGNKGFCYQEQLRNLIMLILVNGFETDPDSVRGKHLLIAKPDPVFFKPGELKYVEVKSGLVGALGIHHVKSWTRSVALHVTMNLLIAEDTLDTFIHASTATVCSSIASIQCNYLCYTDSVAQIDANRGRR